MKFELELWHLIVIGMSCVGFAGTMGKVMLDQYEKRQDERAKAQDRATEESQKVLREILDDLLSSERRNVSALQALEREFLGWKADVPRHYVLREDYLRGQTLLETKIDALFNKIENTLLKSVQHHT